MKELLYIRERELLGRAVYNQDLLIKRMGLSKFDHHSGFDPGYFGISPVYCCKYSLNTNAEHILALANEEGMLALHDTNSPNPSPITVKQVHRNAVFDIAWMENEAKLMTASGDQSAVLWDVNNSDICKISTFLGHTASVKTTAFRPNQNDIFATGARDGKIIIWDVRLSHNCVTSKPDNYIENAHGLIGNFDSLPPGKRKKHANVPPNSIISMVFQDENTLISCGAVDGVIKAWDLRKNYSVYKRIPLPKSRLPEKGPGSPNGFTSLTLDPSRTRLFANCMDSSIYCFNVTTFDSKPVSIYQGHSNHSFYVKCCMSPDGTYLLSGSSDGRAFIWNTSSCQRYPGAILEGHAGEVTSVAWSRNAEPELVTCSDDMTYGIWRVMSETLMDDLRCKLIWVSEEKCQESALSLETKDDPWKICSEKEGTIDHCVTPSRTIRNWVQVQEQTPGTSECEDHNVSPHTPSSNGSKIGKKGAYENLRKGSKRRLEEFLVNGESSKDQDVIIRGERKVLLSNGETGVKRCAKSPLLLTPRDQLRVPPSLGSPSSSPHSISSPTEGLPNYVLDGISPHRHSCTSISRLKENVDWLTRLSKERKGKVNDRYDRFEESATEAVSKRRHRRQVSFESRTKLSSSGNLLKFFQSSICDNVPE